MNPTMETKSATQPVTWEAIQAAHARIAPRIHRAPILTSFSLNKLVSARVFFKCENLQKKTGSFKIRGASNAIFSLSDDEVRHGIVTQSSGNHGAAVACAAAWRGVPAWIVMPKFLRRKTPGDRGLRRSRRTLRAHHDFAQRNVQSHPQRNARASRPYDDDRVVAGQATSAKELLEDMQDLDALFAPVSGGGLLSGTCLSAAALRPATQVFGCEPANADDAYRSITSGALQSIDSADTYDRGSSPCITLSAHLRHPPRKSRRGPPRHGGRNHLGHAFYLGAPQNRYRPSSAVAIAPLLNPGAA